MPVVKEGHEKVERGGGDIYDYIIFSSGVREHAPQEFLFSCS